ncbi:hypothetical protein PsAD2_00668 [Pseudovibrio axinellae]|uniref:Uncharacterized protein n=1 Tax=Pseudovibrio axinellae TaxID=989403 RepID=A0A166APA7_9HYPH|nr:hypothetical protein [Pseudovibrio axinellae]KZL21377.1 hypothetical protein PsAD2_00668 [Pseudovibrio axinellae]SEQ97997.1 hypothetical protein SAMN05421798_105291 [Pseudovibrio axinellae]
MSNRDNSPVSSKGIDRPSPTQLKWLRRGLNEAGGKLPLFDESGRQVPAATVRVCVAAGWAEPWFSNPLKPEWLVCKLTEKGREVLGRDNNSKNLVNHF